MRSTLVKGLQDTLCHDFGSDVSMVAAVIEKGKCVDYLHYQMQLNGKELKEFYHYAKVTNQKLYDEIIEVNEYVIDAWDW